MSEEPRADGKSATDASEKRDRKPSENVTEGSSRRSSDSTSASREKSASSSRDKSASSSHEKSASSARERPKASSRSESGSQDATGKRISAVRAVKKAIEQFGTLTGRPPESVVGTRWKDDHWSVRLEVVESRRWAGDTRDLPFPQQVQLQWM